MSNYLRLALFDDPNTDDAGTGDISADDPDTNEPGLDEPDPDALFIEDTGIDNSGAIGATLPYDTA